jgi:O-antigen/teichoic acid export membrane protein
MFAKVKEFLFKNTTARQTVAKNTFWLSVSNFGGRFLKATLIIYSARVLGAAGWGLFSYAVTLAGFLTLFMDPGINMILTRDAAKATPEERFKILSTAFLIKIFFLIWGVLIIIFVGPLVSTLPGATALLPVIAFIMMFDTIREFFSSLIRGLEKMEWETGIFLFTNLAIVVFGFLFIWYRPTAKSLAWGYAAGTGLGAVVALYTMRDYIKKIFSYFAPTLALPMIRSAWPFAIMGALGMLLTNTDILIISWMRTASDVGIFSAVIRIIQILYLIPSILQLSSLPIFARLANRDNDTFRSALERVTSLVFLISLPMAIGGAILGTQIMRLVFGPEYAIGGLAFQILMITMIVDYPATIISAAVFAYDHQKSLIITSAIGGIGNVIFDLILIPPFGIAGSAVATLLAQTLSNAYLWHVMKKLNHFEILPRLKKIAVATAVMSAVSATLFLSGVPVAANIALCVAVYFLVLKILREPLLKDIRDVLPIGRGKSEGVPA